MNKNILKHFGLAALLALGIQTAGAEDATPETLAELVAAAADGSTIYLGEGSYTLAGSSAATQKTITLVGKGAGLTTFVVGNGTSDGNQGTSDGCFWESHVTLKEMKIVEYPGFTSYLGFMAGESGTLEFVNCTFENTHFANWSRDNRFVGCAFTQSNTSWYNIQELRGKNGDRYYFENCDFISAGGRFINAYKQGGTGTTVYLTIKNCSFSGETQSKAAVNLKSAPGDGCCLQLDFIGENKTTNVKAGSNTGDPLFDDNGSYGVVTLNGSKIWEKGAAVAPVAKNFYQDETDKTLWHVANVTGLKEFGAAVMTDGSTFAGQTVVLDDDMDMSGVTDWTPISSKGNPDRSFQGVFDGQNHVISNFAVQGGNNNGFFATLQGPVTIRNITFDRASVTGAVADKGNMVGIVAAQAYCDATFENITIKGSSVWAFGKVSAILGMAANPGNTTTAFRNCKIENTTVKGAYNCGGLCGLVQNKVVVENCDVAGVTFVLGGRNPETAYVDLVTKATNGGETIDISGKFWKYSDAFYFAAWDRECCYYPTQAELEWKLEGMECSIDANCLAGVGQQPNSETKVVVPEESEIKPVDEEGKEITGDDAEKAREAAKEAVENLGKNTGADMTEGTGVEAAVFAPGDEVKPEVASGLQTAANVVVKDDKGTILSEEEKTEVQQKVAEIATSKDVSSYVKIDVKSPVVKVEDTVATVKTLVFDVQPMAVTKVTTTVDSTSPKTVTVEAPVVYNDAAKPIKFRLPLTDAFTVSAIVTHEGDPDRLCMVQGTAGARYVEVSATHFSLFSVAPSDIVETSASSKTVLGIKRIDYTVTQTTADLAAAVPWLKAADADMPVAQLISTGLSEGDQIQVYDLKKKTYFSWHYDGTSWTADMLSTGVDVPSAETYTLKRGRAFWYKPVGGKGVSGSYTQVGLYSEASITSRVDSATVASASFAHPMHFLMASPKYEDFNLKEKLTYDAGCRADDVVVVVATGARYRFDGSAWGQDIDTAVTKFGVTVTQKVFEPTEGEITVPAGTAFWYLSAAGAPEFEW